jgi:hypothetical protein
MAIYDTLKKAGSKALGGGVAGAIAMVLQVRESSSVRAHPIA